MTNRQGSGYGPRKLVLLALSSFVCVVLCAAESAHAQPTPSSQQDNAASSQVDSELQAQAEVLLADAKARIQQADADGALRQVVAARDTFQRARDAAGELRALATWSEFLFSLQRYEAAVPIYQQAIVVVRQLDDPSARRLESVLLNNLGEAFIQLDRLSDSVDVLRPAIALAHDFGNLENEGTARGNLGRVLLYQGHTAEAIEVFSPALDVYKRLGDARSYATILTFMADAFQSTNQYQDALDAHEALVDMWGRLREAEKMRIALNAVGDNLLALDRYSEALGVLSRALALARASGDRPTEAAALTNMAQVYGRLGDLERRLDYLQQALVIAREQHLRANEGTILNNIGEADRFLGRYDEALDVLQQALVIREEVRTDYGAAVTTLNIGAAYRGLGRFSSAIETYQVALDAMRRVHDRPGEAVALNDLGEAYGETGQYMDALRVLQQALDIRREITSQIGEGATLNNLGQIYAHLGQTPRAIDYQEQALAIVRAVGNRSAAGTVLNNLAVSYERLGDLDRSAKASEDALEVLYDVGDRSGEAAALNNLASTYARLGRTSDARVAYTRALAIAQAIGARALEATAMDNLAGFTADDGRAEDALQQLQQALAITREVGDADGEWRILSHIASVQETQGDLSTALDSDLLALKVLEAIRTSARLEELKTSVAAQSAGVYEHAVLLARRLGLLSEAFDLTERARARTFLDQVSSAHIDLRQGDHLELIRAEQQLRSDVTQLDLALRLQNAKANAQRDESRIRDLTAQLRAKRAEYEDLLTRLKLANPEYASLVSVAPLELAGVQAALGERETLVSYFVSPHLTLAFVVTRHGLKVVDIPVDEQQLADAIRDFRSAGASGPATPSLTHLYGWLIAPLATQLSTRDLHIVPFGVLHYVPFSALSDGTRYVDEDRTISYLPSASVLPHVLAKRKADASSLLALGYGQAQGFPLLRYADTEARTVAGIYGTEAFVGANATEAVVRARGPQTSIVHIAAHGELIALSPLFSRIILAPQAESDGSFEVNKVYDLRLDRADLVVLSACETQLGAHSEGDDVVGLTRAFMYAGTPSVLASLWSVDDEATTALMTAFYTHLHQGQGKAEALRAAEADTRARYPDPRLWSAFVLVGDPGPPAGDELPWLALGAALVLAGVPVAGAGIWLLRRRARHTRTT